jgi:Skp family chaperone for outer membrane proteins
MKKFLTLALAFGLLGMAVPAHALRIAYVDVKKAFDAYQGTQTAKDKLKKQVETEKGKLEDEQTALKAELSALQAKKSVMTESKYKEQEAKVADKIRALQDKIQTTTQDLQQQEAKLTSQIVDLIKEATDKVAKKEKYDFVFEASNILFGGDEITSSVIKELNSK